MEKGYTIAILLCLFFVLSCKERSIVETVPQSPAIFIESEYSNFAWGRVHAGMVIDNSGDVYTYDIVKAGKTWTPSSSGYYSESELYEKFHSCDTLRKIILKDTLKVAHSFVIQITDTLYSQIACPGRDMGSIVTSFYIFRSDLNKFKQVILDEDGDCRYHNEDPNAIELVELIKRQLVF